MTVGERIAYRRQELGLTQEELAFKLGYKTRNAVYQFEKAENMKLSLVKKFAEALNCSTSYLIGNEKPECLTTGDRIRLRRESIGMSQGELAELMGVTRQAISKAELHEGNITFDKIEKFAKALKCSKASLIGSTPKEIQSDQTIRMLECFEQLNKDQQELIISLIQNML